MNSLHKGRDHQVIQERGPVVVGSGPVVAGDMASLDRDLFCNGVCGGGEHLWLS